MLKLHVSESWMMSSLAAAMRRESESWEREGMRESFESGAERRLAGVKGTVGARVAVGSRKEVRILGTDFDR
jgi:hypothetical protein